jgi:hypothetical protein
VILHGRLARHGRQHKGVVAAKMVARVGAEFGWGKPLGTAPYIGKLVPTSHNQCGLQSYVIFVLIRSGLKPAWAARWPLGREVGRMKNRKGGGERRGRMGQTQIPAGFRPVAK